MSSSSSKKVTVTSDNRRQKLSGIRLSSDTVTECSDSRLQCRTEEQQQPDDTRRLYRWTCTVRRSLDRLTTFLLPPVSPADSLHGSSPRSRLNQPGGSDTWPATAATTTTTASTRSTTATALRPVRRPAHRHSVSKNHCHTARLPIFWSLCHSPRQHLLHVVVLFVVGLLPLPATVMARPTDQKWSNPCGVDFESFKEGGSVDEYGAGALEAYANIVSAAKTAEEHTSSTMNQFVEETFGDPNFMKEFHWLSYDWLPKIVNLSEAQLSELKVLSSLNQSFMYLQYFAVAIDQLILDQLVYEGNFLAKFRRMETDLATVLCQMQTAMIKLKKRPDNNVTKGVMSEEERTVESETTRNVRDYIIMRDYQKALVHIVKVFNHFRGRTASGSSGGASSSSS